MIKLFIIILMVTTSEGGMNTIFPPYLEFLNVSISQIGIIVSLFGVTSLLARLPSGAMYTEQRAKTLLSSALVLLGFSTAGLAYNGGQAYVILLTLVHGLAFGAVTTIMLALTIELKPDSHSNGVTMGWYTASISAGYALGSSFSGFLADTGGFQMGFGIIGVFPLVALLVVSTLPQPEAASYPPGHVEEKGELARPNRSRFWRIDLSGLTPTIVLATLVAFYINFLDDAVGTFFPLFGLSIGLSLTAIGGLRSAKSLAATGIRPISGVLFKFVDLRLLNNAAILLWSLVVLLLPEMRLAWIFFIAFILVGISRGLIRVTSATMVAEEKSTGKARLGLASGFYNAGLDLGAFAGPIAGGFLASSWGIPAMFRTVPIVLLIAFLLASVLVTRVEKSAAKTISFEQRR